MAPRGVPGGNPVTGVVDRDRRGEPLAGRLHSALTDALRSLGVTPRGRTLVVVRLSPPTPVAAGLAHALVDVLIESGCDSVTLGASVGARDRDRGHDSVFDLARRHGLTGRTTRGRAYDVADLGADVVPAPVPVVSVLDGQAISRLWVESPTRVVLGRAVTDLLDGYAAVLATLLGVVTEVAGATPDDVVVDVLRYAPPLLAVVDALTTSDGADGGRILSPVQSGTVVVTTDAVLADGTVAGLIGADRSSSRLVEAAVAALGEPRGQVAGDLTPWPGVAGPHPLARGAARRVAADARLARVLSAATGGPDEEAAATDPVLSAVRAVLTPAVRAASDPVGQASLVTLLAAVGTLASIGGSWATVFDKDRVDRLVVPLGFDPSAFTDDEYDSLPDFLAPFEAMLAALSSTGGHDGLRWTLVDGATVFEVSRHIAADFDEFVARVDVAEGISLMADYLGGRRVLVGAEVGVAAGSRQDGARTTRTRQAERNLYLPQPNYLVAWGGRPIDVCKIELVERGPDTHRLLWRTVRSPNGSASHDDGSLTFSRAGAGTTATVRGRQLFTVPPIVDAAGLTAVPEVRGPLLEDAYRRFFTTTFDNLEACFEGREFRIGRPPPDPGEPLLTEAVQLVLAAIGDRSRSGPGASAARVGGPTRATTQTEVDPHGFRHVRGSR